VSRGATASVYCHDCGAELPLFSPRAQCPCGGLLEVRQSPREPGRVLRARFDRRRRSDPAALGSGVWRFRELLLPGRDAPVTHPEGNTSLYRRDAVSRWVGLQDLALKHEGENPTGSFKDRGMTVAVTHARRAGATAVACASTGNTSASMAAYAAQAGLPALVFVPAGKVAAGKLAQALAFGARTLLLEGDFDTCLRLVREASEAFGMALLNSINPWRLEGQKTIVWELLQQRGWDPPDWIVVPAGNLGNTAAFGKALREARALPSTAAFGPASAAATGSTRRRWRPPSASGIPRATSGPSAASARRGAW
jgi:threonine synthase